MRTSIRSCDRYDTIVNDAAAKAGFLQVPDKAVERARQKEA